ncbi:MAG TPA: SAM-dependent methyltransferase [Kofleriaceae bacterium]|nr:SAM-dependent methyltransferase [Kofleriaceae bacterium]
MKAGTPSRTAAWVALARGMAANLPRDARLADDPYGAAFEDPGPRRRLHHALERAGVPIHRLPGVTPWILYMQVRTRVIDDALRGFVATGGRQLVLLGAGFDCRALRMPELAGTRVVEVDHPATQARKREVLAERGAASPARYLAWDFEQRPLAELPDAIAGAGLDRAAPSFTIWEGVTMYLTPRAIDASLRAIRAWSAPGSQLAVTYFVPARLERPSWPSRVVRAVVARVGEPFRFAWDPAELPGYLAERGFRVERDQSIAEAARALLPRRYSRRLRMSDQRVAIATV